MTSAIIGHLVGDYLLQNDWMALGKKRSSWICATHATVWTLAVCSIGGLWDWRAAAVLFATHFLQDRTNLIAWWMETVGQHQFRTGPCSPWSTIVVDNVWHLVTIWCVFQMWS